MMAQRTVDIQIDSSKLSVQDEYILRENLRNIEEQYLNENRGTDDEKALLKLRLVLVERSLELENAKLALLVVAKLNLVQLALLLRKTILPDSRWSEKVALYYVASYFHLSDVGSGEKFAKLSCDNRVERDLKESLELNIAHGQWEAAFESVDCDALSPGQRELYRKKIDYKLAEHLEIGELYDEAIGKHRSLASGGAHVVRLLIKRDLNRALVGLEEESAESGFAGKLLDSQWLRLKHSLEGEAEQQTIALARRALLKGKLEESVHLLAPPNVRSFLIDSDHEKWSDRRKIELIVSTVSGLHSDTRKAIADLALRCQHANQLATACCLYLALGQASAALGLLPRLLKPSRVLSAINQFELSTGGCLESERALLEHLQRCRSARATDLVRLGLLDEALLMLTTESSSNEREFQLLAEQLDGWHERSSPDHLDAEISQSTWELIERSLSAAETSASSPLLSVLILATAVLVNRLQVEEDGDGVLPKVEQSFARLSANIKALSFNASQMLVKATNVLVAAVKDNLEALAGSDVTREAFRLLVEGVAGKCLMESQYKSAASLYSQIDDNLNAIRSLMRTGDVEVVINYALLVRDVTLNRITINYLRHLDVDSETIQDFMARSRM